MDRINVRVDDHLKAQLESGAKRKGVSPSAIVRQLLQERYQQDLPAENCHQLAQRLGVLGSIKGLPADLSMNPNHMEGLESG